MCAKIKTNSANFAVIYAGFTYIELTLTQSNILAAKQKIKLRKTVFESSFKVRGGNLEKS